MTEPTLIHALADTARLLAAPDAGAETLERALTNVSQRTGVRITVGEDGALAFGWPGEGDPQLRAAFEQALVQLITLARGAFGRPGGILDRDSFLHELERCASAARWRDRQLALCVFEVEGMTLGPGIDETRLVETVGSAARESVRSADLVGFAPGLTYRVAPPSWIAVSIYYGAAALWWTLRRSSTVFGRRASALLAVGAALWILVDPRTLIARRGDGMLHVTFIDVGQGDSTFVVFPRGSTLLVDAGGLASSSSFDIGDRVVAPVVRDAGFRRLDYVALTHGDPDHIGGAGSILRELRPREVWEGIPVPRFEPLTALRLATQAAGARWANVYAGDRLVADDVEIIARHPMVEDWERQKVRNDDSIVLELRWRDVSVLLTGDIGKAVERIVESAIPPARLRIIKVPHHGSLTSSTPAFLNAVRPQIAVVSAGRSNHFGHPVPEVLDRYRSVGAEVFRTDQDGAVTVDTDGYSLAVHTFTGRRLSLR